MPTVAALFVPHSTAQAAAANLAKLPPTCYAIAAAAAPGARVVLIKAGRAGHLVTELDDPRSSPQQVLAFVAKLNKRLNVTREQQVAMLAGSMFGWHVRAADPDIYKAH